MDLLSTLSLVDVMRIRDDGIFADHKTKAQAIYKLCTYVARGEDAFSDTKVFLYAKFLTYNKKA